MPAPGNASNEEGTSSILLRASPHQSPRLETGSRTGVDSNAVVLPSRRQVMSGLAAKLEAKTDRSAGPDACHMWLGGVGEWGQPCLCVSKNKSRSVRRVAWELAHGVELTKVDWVTVACGNHRCLNPKHLALRSRRSTDQFWARVEKTDACWLWTGSTYGIGYGQFKHANKNRAAHIFSYELHHGPVPEGLVVCHHCDVPGCVRPDHLFVGTHKDNTQDMMRKGRNRNKPRSDQFTSDPEVKP